MSGFKNNNNMPVQIALKRLSKKQKLNTFLSLTFPFLNSTINILISNNSLFATSIFLTDG